MRRAWGSLLALVLLVSTAHAEPAKRTHHRRKHAEPASEPGTQESPAPANEAAPPPSDKGPAAPTPTPPPAEAAPATPPAPASNPAVKVSTTLDKSELKVGEVAKLQVVVDAPSSMESSLPEQSFGGLELIDRRLKTEPLGGRTRTTYELDLLALNPGDASIPALQIRLVGANGELSDARSDARALHVSSLLANEPNAEPKPPTAPQSVIQDDYTVAWVALGLLGVAVVVALTLLISRWLKRRPKPVAPPPPPRPPWELARERLEQLARAREPLFAEHKGEEFVAGVSDALREYLGRRYGFDGLERTTHELMSTLEKLRPHSLQLAELATVLEVCDLVKFARMAPDAAQGLQLWNSVRQIVDATTPSGTSLPPMPEAEPAR
ncbi:MAG TPA: BatD family protein [Polyangiales bacterium]